MNKTMKRLLTFLSLTLLVGAFWAVQAANHRSQQIVGDNTLTTSGTLYPGTATNFNVFRNMSTTFYITGSSSNYMWNQAYLTNIVVTNVAVRTPFIQIPGATNSTTGAIVPSFAQDVGGFADANGNVGSAVLSLTALEAGGATSAVTLTFVPSSDGYDFPAASTSEGAFSFAFTPSATAETLKTNLPSAFMQGTKKVRLLNVNTGSNTTGSFTILSLSLDGYIP